MRTGAALLLLIYAVTATAQAHAALDAALAAYPQIHARETEKLKNGDPTAKFVLARGMNGLGNRNYGLVASFALARSIRKRRYTCTGRSRDATALRMRRAWHAPRRR